MFGRSDEKGTKHVDRGSEAKIVCDPLSIPSCPITRLKAKQVKEARSGLIQEH